MTSVQVQCWGAGGGGGGPANVAGTNYAGGGGGGGAYAIKVYPVVAGTTYKVSIDPPGAGGAAGISGFGMAGNAGGDVWFDSATTVLAKGGSGGPYGGSAMDPAPGGSIYASIGDTVYGGGGGGAGQSGALDVGGAGGGSSAGTGANGNAGTNATTTTGQAGGAAPAGGFAGGAGGTAGAGVGGTSPGGGGGSSSGNSFATSGTGGAGQIVLTWTAANTDAYRGPMIVRPTEDPEPGIRPIFRRFSPNLSPAWSVPFVRWLMRVRVPDFADMEMPRAIRTFLPQIATRLVGPATRRPVMVVPQVQELEVRTHATVIGNPGLIDLGRRYGAARGLYRVLNAAGYRFYRSNVAPPATSDTPFATNATLPFTPANTYADGTWYLSVSYFNGVLDSGFLPIGPRGETYLVLTITGGVATATKPSPPMSAQLEVRAGGVIRVLAVYGGIADGVNRADSWGIAYTVDGSTPPSGAATLTQTIETGALSVLAYDLPAQADGTTVKVQLQTKRGSVYSLPGTVLSAVAVAIGPTAPVGIQDWTGALPEEL